MYAEEHEELKVALTTCDDKFLSVFKDAGERDIIGRAHTPKLEMVLNTLCDIRSMRREEYGR